MYDAEPEDDDLELPQPPTFDFKRIIIYAAISMVLQLVIRYTLGLHPFWGVIVATVILAAGILVKIQLEYWNQEWEEDQLSIDVQVEDFRRQLDEH
jgi:hypothetical protein